MGFDTLSLTIFAVLFLAWGAFWFLRRNDELPLAIAVFNLIFVRRLLVIEGNFADWAHFGIDLGFSYFGYPNLAATCMLLGAVLLVAAYCVAHKPTPKQQLDSDEFLQAFISKQLRIIVIFFGIFVGINLAIRASFYDAPATLTEQSYAYLFTLAHSGFIILIAVLLAYLRRGSVLQQMLILGLVAIAGYLTLSPSLRFSMLGWAVALAIVFTRKLNPLPRAVILFGSGIAVALAFSIAGAMRQEDARYLGPAELVDEAVTILTTGSDVNMVDGFVMLIQVYPDVLPYGLGTEHLEILMRPIPRAIWPDKPVGGWTQKFAVASGLPLFTTGISPSLYGSFYGEGGVLGIIFFSLLYGLLFAMYVNWANRYQSALRWVLRGVLIASLFPLMRGGDIPGIAAFIGMSYWPLAVFVWSYRRARRSRMADIDGPNMRGRALRPTWRA